MAYKTLYDDIIFIEGEEPNAQIVKSVEYNYGSIGSQLKNLNDVKNALAQQAKLNNCNCIFNFKYGQKSRFFSLDDMKWYGNGECAILSKELYDKYVEEIKLR